ncbi:splicing factor, arginine/serine-rich [Achlya hypogyna]|uniref:Splicing factor, arginine/serine-rich n=1 Tax=Achlya hypogyna TaxID=1202772 RepID=A0A1V9Y9A3_ACHHY|nr:splicing factor, arginine/serine-rich [Achlya hypogyna]
MSKVYVGNLGEDVCETDVRAKFAKFGPIASMEVKVPARPPAFAFIEFVDPRDAEDAVREMHGRDLAGLRMRVEMAKGSWGRGADRRCHNSARASFSLINSGPIAPVGSLFRVSVRNLSDHATSRDLKTFLQSAGDVVHATVDRRGSGAASFQSAAQLEQALRCLNGADLQGHAVRLQRDLHSHRGRSRSPTPRRSGRRSYSPLRLRSRSRGRRCFSRSRSRS